MDTQSFKIRMSLLDEVRPVAEKNKRSVQGQIEVFVEQGLRGNKEVGKVEKAARASIKDAQQILINYSELMKSHVQLQAEYNELRRKRAKASR